MSKRDGYITVILFSILSLVTLTAGALQPILAPPVLYEHTIVWPSRFIINSIITVGALFLFFKHITIHKIVIALILGHLLALYNPSVSRIIPVNTDELIRAILALATGPILLIQSLMKCDRHIKVIIGTSLTGAVLFFVLFHFIIVFPAKELENDLLQKSIKEIEILDTTNRLRICKTRNFVCSTNIENFISITPTQALPSIEPLKNISDANFFTWKMETDLPSSYHIFGAEINRNNTFYMWIPDTYYHPVRLHANWLYYIMTSIGAVVWLYGGCILTIFHKKT